MNSKNAPVIGIILILILFFILINPAAEEYRPIPEGALQKKGGAYFNSSNYQAGIQSGGSLGQLAKRHSSVGEDPVSYGFAAISDESKFFIIGTLYAESLANLRGGDLKTAANLLEAIENQFIALQVPGSLYNYVSKVRNRIHLERYSSGALMDMLSFFQPFFEDYAKSLSEDKLILFQSGSWLVDMSLTAAANDRQLIKHNTPQLNYLTQEMKRMDAPRGVLDALEEMNKIASKDKISDRDVENVLKQVRKIQSILG